MAVPPVGIDDLAQAIRPALGPAVLLGGDAGLALFLQEVSRAVSTVRIPAWAPTR